MNNNISGNESLFEKLVEQEMQRQLDSIRKIAPEVVPPALGVPQAKTTVDNKFPNNGGLNPVAKSYSNADSHLHETKSFSVGARPDEGFNSNSVDVNVDTEANSTTMGDRSPQRSMSMSSYPSPNSAYREALGSSKSVYPNYPNTNDVNSNLNVPSLSSFDASKHSSDLNNPNSDVPNLNLSIRGSNSTTIRPKNYAGGLRNSASTEAQFFNSRNSGTNNSSTVRQKNFGVAGGLTNSSSAAAIGFGRGLNALHAADDEDPVSARQRLLEKKKNYQMELDKQLEEKKKILEMQMDREKKKSVFNSSTKTKPALNTSPPFSKLRPTSNDIQSNPNNIQSNPNPYQQYQSSQNPRVSLSRSSPISSYPQNLDMNGIPLSSVTRIGESEAERIHRRKLKQLEYAKVLEEQMREREEIKRKQKEKEKSEIVENDNSSRQNLMLSSQIFEDQSSGANSNPSSLVSPVEYDDFEKQQRRAKQEQAKMMLAEQISEKKRREAYEKKMQEERDRLDELKLERQREEMRLAYEREKFRYSRNTPNNTNSHSQLSPPNHNIPKVASKYEHVENTSPLSPLMSLEQPRQSFRDITHMRNLGKMEGGPGHNYVNTENDRLEADLRKKREEVYMMQQQQANLEQEIERQRLELQRLHSMGSVPPGSNKSSSAYNPYSKATEGSPIGVAHHSNIPKGNGVRDHPTGVHNRNQYNEFPGINSERYRSYHDGEAPLHNQSYQQKQATKSSNALPGSYNNGNIHDSNQYLHNSPDIYGKDQRSFHRPILAESPPLNKIYQQQTQKGLDNFSVGSSMTHVSSKHGSNYDDQVALEQSMVSQSKLVKTNLKNKRIAEKTEEESDSGRLVETWRPRRVNSPFRIPTCTPTPRRSSLYDEGQSNDLQKETSLVEQSLPCASRYFIYVAEKKANPDEPQTAISMEVPEAKPKTMSRKESGVSISQKIGSSLSRSRKSYSNDRSKQVEAPPTNWRNSEVPVDQSTNEYKNTRMNKVKMDVIEKPNKKSSRNNIRRSIYNDDDDDSDRYSDEFSQEIPESVSVSGMRDADVGSEALTPMPRALYNHDPLPNHRQPYRSHLEERHSQNQNQHLDGTDYPNINERSSQSMSMMDDLERSRVRTAQAARMALQRASAHSDDDDVIITDEDAFRDEDEEEVRTPRRLTSSSREMKSKNKNQSKKKSKSHKGNYIHGAINANKSGKRHDENINTSNDAYTLSPGTPRSQISQIGAKAKNKSQENDSVMEQSLRKSFKGSASGGRFVVHTPNGKVKNQNLNINFASKEKLRRSTGRLSASDLENDFDMDSLPSYFSDLEV